jgi:hypothetical protein
LDRWYKYVKENKGDKKDTCQSRDPMTETSTPKFVEEVVVEVMKVGKVTKLIQTMAIVSLNMRNLTLEVSILKNRLVTRENEKKML